MAKWWQRSLRVTLPVDHFVMLTAFIARAFGDRSTHYYELHFDPDRTARRHRLEVTRR